MADPRRNGSPDALPWCAWCETNHVGACGQRFQELRPSRVTDDGNPVKDDADGLSCLEIARRALERVMLRAEHANKHDDPSSLYARINELYGIADRGFHDSNPARTGPMQDSWPR